MDCISEKVNIIAFMGKRNWVYLMLQAHLFDASIGEFPKRIGIETGASVEE